LLGVSSNVLLVTGNHSSEGYMELHPLEEVDSISEVAFVSLDPIDLNKLSPVEYEVGQVYTTMFSEQIWQPKKFDSVLKDIANDKLRAFFISIKDNCIVAPYDGGIDFILKDEETKKAYKEKYKEWLSPRQDGL
ncbi:MAG TPA: hypothetical protein VFD56_02050, partial [Chitinophagaceae bacterium]|nr:hypothetical protein [Chitinophagaceae bacterium]